MSILCFIISYIVVNENYQLLTLSLLQLHSCTTTLVQLEKHYIFHPPTTTVAPLHSSLHFITQPLTKINSYHKKVQT